MKPSEPTTSFNDLPLEMISELFEYLDLKDLVACSMVNRCLHSVYAAFRVHSLAAIDHPDDHIKWHNPNQKIREVVRCPTRIFHHLVEKTLLSNLKNLVVCSRLEFDLNRLNQFKQLVHLELTTNSFRKMRAHLNLPRLKVLAFHRFNLCCALFIDCPLLSTLVYCGEEGDANLLKLKHPETVRKLVTDMVDPKWLAQFRNVECLVTRKFEAINEATLIFLPALRELHYNRDIERVFVLIESHKEIGTVDRLKQMLGEFLDEAKKLRGDDFRFRFAGLQLTNMAVEQIDFGLQVDARNEVERACKEHVYMKYYHLIEPGAIDFVHNIHYTRLFYHLQCHGLLSDVTGEFLGCFSKKFTDIEHVRATAEVEDVDHFRCFLKSLRSLRSLVLEKTALGQEFYDQLPTLANPLRRLFLMDGHCEKGLKLNFDFLSKLSRLSMLEIHPPVSFESLRSLARGLDRLEECGFSVRLREKLIRVRKASSSAKWRVDDADGAHLMKIAENPDEIVKFFEGLRD